MLCRLLLIPSHILLLLLRPTIRGRLGHHLPRMAIALWMLLSTSVALRWLLLWRRPIVAITCRTCRIHRNWVEKGSNIRRMVKLEMTDDIE